ncbi:MAG TPA: hypothetical protein VME24_01140 [Alphaproteobacteria bacterium]|nr:hypothetical protein [Alphaproteobacteria bacterium]
MIYKNDMSGKARQWIFWIIPIFLALTVASCKKAAAPGSATESQTGPAASPAETNQDEFAWNLKTLVESYKQAGRANPKWDAPAILALTEFARARSGPVTNEPWGQIISTNIAAAVQAGCDDPLVRYLFVKFTLDQTNSRETFADQFCDVALDMQNSSYPPILKFYAAQRAVDQLFYTYGYHTNNFELHPMFGKMTALIGPNLLSALNDKSMPAEQAFQACDAALTSMKGEGIPDYTAYSQAYSCMEGPIFQNWPNAYTSWLLKGEAYVQLAWGARGTGYADTVTPDGWKLFSQRLAVAESALTNAWQLNSNDWRIANHMLEVELGQGEGRDRLDLWFQRAMALNPYDYDACSTKLLYLQPKWYGSTDDMLEFGHECATNMAWQGEVPLILLDAHYCISCMYTNEADQENYWKQPDVWPDIQTAYERFFQVNPDATGRYGQYAFYAYKCGKWKAFLDLIPKFGPGSYDYFGGRDQFDKMVQVAKQNVGS